MRMQFAAAAVLFALPLGGCAVAALGTAGAVGVAAAQEKSLGEAVDDATASNEIKSKLLSESANKFGEVDVEVTGGLVLLSGRVNTPEERVKAEGIAWTSHLTRDVANEIRIQPPGGFLAMPPQLSDGRVSYLDGTEATVEQMAKDVGAFLQWAGEPKQSQRKSTGLAVMIYLVILAILLWFSFHRIWRSDWSVCSPCISRAS